MAGKDFRGMMIMSLGIFAGAFVISAMDSLIPHEHLFSHKAEGRDFVRLKKIWLFVIAIFIHNFPEGLATGVSAAPGSEGGGLTMAAAIAMQNMPEGLSVSAALSEEKYSVKFAFLIALITGMIEPVGAVIGFWLAGVSLKVLPFILSFAAGAMLFVIVDEIVPELKSRFDDRTVGYSIITGFVIMMCLDRLL